MSDLANEKLTELKEFVAHYSSQVQKGEGRNVVTHAEMAVVLDTVVDLFATTGVGIRKGALGQAMPEKKGWERHG